ncbi:hypothetical protein K525DRAFT_265390 [Schizophyllum commune Loenen D]|nr:hypothetical protein K525DRAFT_265390 [Schizophyllum commune Loenen D]
MSGGFLEPQEFIADHRCDTPPIRPSGLPERFQAHVWWLWGNDVSMLDGSSDVPLNTIHGIARSFPASEPLLFNILKMTHGYRTVLNNGKASRGLNLDSPPNLERLDPTLHAMHEARVGKTDWSPLPSGWMKLADDIELAKADRRSLDEIRPGHIFAHHVLTFDNTSFRTLVYDVDGPFRSTTPPSGSIGSAADEGVERTASPSAFSGNEGTESSSVDLTGSAADEGEERAPSPCATRSDPEPQIAGTMQARRKSRVVLFQGLCDWYILYSTFHPVLALYNIMIKFRARLATFDTWPLYMKTIYRYIEPRMRHLFAIPIFAGPTLLANPTENRNNSRKKGARAAQTTPEGPSIPVTRSRLKALTEAQNQAAKANVPKTRSQTAAAREASKRQTGASPNATTQAKSKSKKAEPAASQPKTRAQGSRPAVSYKPTTARQTPRAKAYGAEPKDGKEPAKPVATKRAFFKVGLTR